MLLLSGQPFNRLVCPQVQTLKSESRRFELPLYRLSHCGIQPVSGARMAVKVYRRFAAVAAPRERLQKGVLIVQGISLRTCLPWSVE